MRICPSCQTQYTDDTLRFCLQDGAPLQVVPATRQPTVSLEGREMETAARQTAPESVATQWRRDSEVTSVRAVLPKRKGPNGIMLAAGAAAGILVLLAGAGAIGLWLYLRPPADYAKNTVNGNRDQNAYPPYNINMNTIATPTRTPVQPTPSPSATVVTNGNSFKWPPYLLGTPTPSRVDSNKASEEISQQIGKWRSQAETGDLNGVIGKYATSVDYYNKRGASPGFIRADKQRAYKLYNSMSIRISNMDVSVGSSGETATAAFDKEWVFSGSSRSTGKVRQQLRLARINGEWLITGERDIKVYYTN